MMGITRPPPPQICFCVAGWVDIPCGQRPMKTIGHHFVVALQQLRLMLPLLLLWRPDVSLQASTNAITPYGVRAWQTDDGLPQNSVHAIAQGREGYLWVGTREGLVRFDGVRFAD